MKQDELPHIGFPGEFSRELGGHVIVASREFEVAGPVLCFTDEGGHPPQGRCQLLLSGRIEQKVGEVGDRGPRSFHEQLSPQLRQGAPRESPDTGGSGLVRSGKDARQQFKPCV